MINNKTVEFEVKGIPYVASANIGSMYRAEKLSGGRTFMNLLFDTKKGLLEPFVILLATCVKIQGEKESLGLDYVCELDQDTFGLFLEPLMEAVLEALPKTDDNQKKK